MIKEKYDAVMRASEPFKKTKRAWISRTAAVGRKHKLLKYPILVWIVIFIFFVNLAFYIMLGILTHKRGVTFAMGLLLLALGGYGVWSVVGDYGQSRELYTSTAQQFTVERLATGSIAEISDATATDSNPSSIAVQINWYEKLQVDFGQLQNLNSDIVGWLFFENEDISYPILQGKNNDVYLRTTYDGKSARAGSIFLDCLNKNDFSDMHTLIYGHNMRDETMFGKLKNYYREEGYFENHKYFQVITPSECLRYEVIAYKTVPGDGDIYNIFTEDSVGYLDWLKDCIFKGNYASSGWKPDYRDKIITLSTCTSGNDRFVVCGRLIDSHEQ